MAVLGRAVAGGSIFMTEYWAQGGEGLVAFAAKLPGADRPPCPCARGEKRSGSTR